MNIEYRLLKEVWGKATQQNMVRVNVSKSGRASEKMAFRIGAQTIQGTCLTDVVVGNAIAILTDQGNWYILGETRSLAQFSSRTIEYRTTSIKQKLIYPIKTIFAYYDISTNSYGYYIGGNGPSKKKGDFILEESSLFLGIGELRITNVGKSELITILYNTKFKGNRKLLNNVFGEETIFHLNQENDVNRFNSSFFYLGSSFIQSGERLNTQNNETQNFSFDKNIFTTINSTYINNANLTAWSSSTRVGDTDEPYTYSESLRSDFDQSNRLIREKYVTDITGTFLLRNTTNGYISQKISFTKEKVVEYTPYAGSSLGSAYSIATSAAKEINNEITLYYSNKSTVLNTDDFLIFTPSLPVVIHKESTSFVAIADYLYEFINNNIVAKNYDYDYQINFNPSSWNGEEVLFSCEDINTKEILLVKGIVSSATFTLHTIIETRGRLTLNVAVTETLVNVKTSFFGTMISNNGSFYNYLFRGNLFYFPPGLFGSTGIPGNKIILKVLAVAPFVVWLLRRSIYGLECENNNQFFLTPPWDNLLKRDSIVDNKIYSVIDTDKENKKLVEEWEIQDDGKVKYSKVFTVNFYPTFSKETNLGNYYSSYSYHP